MRTITTVLALAMLVAPAFAKSKKSEHVPYKVAKFALTESPARVVKQAAKYSTAPVRHPVRAFKFLF